MQVRSPPGICIVDNFNTCPQYIRKSCWKSNLKTNRCKHIGSCTITPVQPVGIVPKDHHTDNSSQWQIDLSDKLKDMEEIVPIFLKTIQKQSIRNALHAMDLIT